MTFTISADDPRTIRALEIAAEADQWLKGRNRAGEDVFHIVSGDVPEPARITPEAVARGGHLEYPAKQRDLF